jgi:hypothetical protein
MKTKVPPRVVRLWVLAGVAAALFAIPLTSYSQDAQPVITSIRTQNTNVVVEATVPAGIRRVTLETRARFGAGTWVPAAVAQTDGTAGKITFRVPLSRNSEMLRARAEPTAPLPADFYTGTNLFWGPSTNVVDVAGFEFTGSDLKGADATTPGERSREVVESDIWKVSGDTLYFFNQYRGLQVIDITEPDKAFVRGTLHLPAAGEQMYVAAASHVILLARNDCTGNTDESRVLVVSAAGATPQIVTNLTVPGWIQESRMVGDVLFVASQSWRQVPGTTNAWEWGSVVSSFDLADPAHPAARGTIWHPGYGNAVSATDSYLFVATQDPTNWWQSVVNVIDITSPDGEMVPYGSVETGGRINDKFKLNYVDEILTTISEDWRRTTTNNVLTRLETFQLPLPGSVPPAKIQRLAELELGRGEQLHATRFDGNRVYVVTFFRIDPLWVVDLSNPAKPHIAGAVDVPGWSTYILPLGERLVSVGVESNRVAVSLFDVRDPASPDLLSRVRLGLNYSWSEANSDEKAFTVLTDLGLILVPYSGDTTNGWTSRVQLIDLTPTALVARGIIEHQFQPRRAMHHRDRVLSLSGAQLLSVYVTDRDDPLVRGVTDLAWSVDRLLLADQYILELSSGSQWWWDPASWAGIRVAAAGEPDRLVGRLPLEPMPVVGASLRDGRLYVAQGPSGGDLSDTNTPNFFFTVVDASKLPELSVVGREAVRADVPPWTGDWEAVWPKPGIVVWVGGGADYWWWGPWLSDFTEPGRLGGGMMLWSPVMRTGGGHLLAFDVSTATDPKLLSELNLEDTNTWSFSKPFTEGTLVYLTHRQPEAPPKSDDGTWVHRYYLDVIDYADPASPTLRKPLNVPGTLQGISHVGEMLYTTRWDTNGVTEWLEASAYNGVNVSLVASLPLPEAWPRPLLILDTNVLLGRAKYAVDATGESEYRLETWTLASNKEFKLLGALKLEQPVSTLVARRNLLAAQDAQGSILLFDATQPASLVPVGGESVSGCFWSNLKYSDGDLNRGLWVPMGMYGVNKVESLLP